MSVAERSSGIALVTGTGLQAGEATADGIAEVGLDDGAHRSGPAPTSELPSHLALLRAGHGAVIHTHAPHATALGLVLDEVPLVLAEQAARAGAAAPVVPYATPGSEEMALSLAAALRGPVRAVVIRNHGLVHRRARHRQRAVRHARDGGGGAHLPARARHRRAGSRARSRDRHAAVARRHHRLTTRANVTTSTRVGAGAAQQPRADVGGRARRVDVVDQHDAARPPAATARNWARALRRRSSRSRPRCGRLPSRRSGPATSSCQASPSSRGERPPRRRRRARRPGRAAPAPAPAASVAGGGSTTASTSAAATSAALRSPRSFQARTSAWAGPASVTAPRAEANARRRPGALAARVGVAQRRPPAAAAPRPASRTSAASHAPQTAGPGTRQERHRAGAKSALTSTLRACPLLHPAPFRAERDDSVPVLRQMQPFPEARGIVARMAVSRRRRPRGLGRVLVFALLAAAGAGAGGARLARRLDDDGTSSAAAPTDRRRVERGVGVHDAAAPPAMDADWKLSTARRGRGAVGRGGRQRGQRQQGDRADVRRRPVRLHRPGARHPRPARRQGDVLHRRPQRRAQHRADPAHGRVGPRDRQPHLVARVADGAARRRPATRRCRARTTSSAAPSGTRRGCSGRRTARCARARTARCAGPGCCPSSGASTRTTTSPGVTAKMLIARVAQGAAAGLDHPARTTAAAIAARPSPRCPRSWTRSSGSGYRAVTVTQLLNDAPPEQDDLAGRM